MDGSASISSASPVTGHHRLVLSKDGGRWIFRWRSGDEPAVLRAAFDLAQRRRGGFDLVDAAAVHHRVRRLRPGALGADNDTRNM